MTSRSLTLSFALTLATGCASSPQPAPAGSPAEATTLQTSSPATPIDLATLEGTWTRDDGKRYRLVLEDTRLVGSALEEATEFGCRVELEAGDAEGSLDGEASFTRRRDGQALFRTRWRLKAASQDRLEGELEGVDLDEGDREVARSWEPHTFQREEPSAEGESGAEPQQASLDGTLDETSVAASSPRADDAEAGPGGHADMRGFMAKFTGDSAGVEAALDQFGAPGLERHEMDWYDLGNPRVVTQTSRDGLEWFTLEADAGMTIRTYELAWQGSQLVEVVDRGLR